MSFDPALISRHLIRSLDRATLASKMQKSDGEPYASLVMAACGHDASPLIYLSDLAVHTQNLRVDNRCSLLFDATYGLNDPLMGKRISLQGKAFICEDPLQLDRYTARHPGSEMYKSFKDFNLFKIEIERVHLVAGFGRIHWVDGDEIRFDTSKTNDLDATEGDIVSHMNSDHSAAINLYANKLAKQKGVGWQMSNIDPEGFDLRLGAEICRCNFPAPISNAGEARAQLVEMAKIARNI